MQVPNEDGEFPEPDPGLAIYAGQKPEVPLPPLPFLFSFPPSLRVHAGVTLLARLSVCETISLSFQLFSVDGNDCKTIMQSSVYMYIYIYIHMCNTHTNMCDVCMYAYVYIHIHIHV